MKTFSRVGIYLIGFWAAWYLSKTNRELQMNRNVKISLWIAAISIFTSLIWVHMFQESSYVYGGLFPAFGRIIYGLIMAYVIIACISGHGGIISRVLNADIFLPFSRISYSSYLLHPLIYLLVIYSHEKSFHFGFGMGVSSYL